MNVQMRDRRQISKVLQSMNRIIREEEEFSCEEKSPISEWRRIILSIGLVEYFTLLLQAAKQ